MDIGTRHEGHHHGQEANRARDRIAAASLWYAVLAAVFAVLLSRALRWLRLQSRSRRPPATTPSEKEARTLSALDRAALTLRGAALLQIRWNGPIAWLSPPPLGKSLLITAYCVFMAILSTAGVKTTEEATSASTEPYAFRTGWTALASLPLLFILVSRYTNPLSRVSRHHSYERLNWAHRWISAVFIAVSVAHGSLFAHQWIRGDMFWDIFQINPQAVSGAWALAILAWTAVASAAPVRKLSHEAFVVQHVVSAVALLGVMLWHVGKHNRGLVWYSIGVFATDVFVRVVMGARRNFRLFGGFGDGRGVGHAAELSVLDESTVVLTVRRVGFAWAVGQHVYVWTPALPWQTPHPFTIMGEPGPRSGPGSGASPARGGTIQLVVRTKNGFTQKLREQAREPGRDDGTRPLPLVLLGPFGKTPDWHVYDTVVLVSASTGASFAVPVLESLLQAEHAERGRVRRIHALIIGRRRDQLGVYLGALRRALANKRTSITLSVRLAITISHGADGMDLDLENEADESRQRLTAHALPAYGREDPRLSTDSMLLGSESASSEMQDEADDVGGGAAQVKTEREHLPEDGANSAADELIPHGRQPIQVSSGRPDLESYLRDAMGDARGGRVMVAACGGKGFIADTRNAVGRIIMSQGLRGGGDAGPDVSLYVEEFGL